MAVNMYRAHDMWDDAIRVAKSHGGVNASKQVRDYECASIGCGDDLRHVSLTVWHGEPSKSNRFASIDSNRLVAFPCVS
jgi:hypothetical protein